MKTMQWIVCCIAWVVGHVASEAAVRPELVAEDIVNNTGKVVNGLNVKFKNGAIVSIGVNGKSTATKSIDGSVVQGNINGPGTAVDFPPDKLGNVGDGIGTPGDNRVTIRYNRSKNPFFLIQPGNMSPPDVAIIDRATTEWRVGLVPQGQGIGVRHLELRASIGIDENTNTAFAQFFSYDSVPITVSNITLWKNNSLGTFNVDDFDTLQDGTPLAGFGPEIVGAGVASLTYNFGEIDILKYQLVTAEVEASAFPGEVFRVAAATVPVPEPTGGGLTLSTLLLLMLKRSRSGTCNRAKSS